MKKLYIILFMCFLILPTLLSFFIKDAKQMENKQKAPFPSLSSGPSAYLQGIDDFYTDRTPFKNTAVKMMSSLNHSVDKDVETNLGVLGKENWMFYKGDDGVSSMNDYLGINNPTKEETDRSRQKLASLNELIEEKGATLIVLICPNKEDVYGEYLPDKYQKSKDRDTYVQQFYHSLKRGNDNVFFPIEKLSKTDSFYKFDTHWNSLGAYSSVLEIEQYLKYPSVPLSEVVLDKSYREDGDLISILQLEEGEYGKDSVYNIGTGKEVKVKLVKDVSYGNSIAYQAYESNSKNDASLYLIGDSFSTAMKPFLCEDFKKSTFIHRSDLVKLDMNIKKGDVVIVETVGRSVGSIADSFDALQKKITGEN